MNKTDNIYKLSLLFSDSQVTGLQTWMQHNDLYMINWTCNGYPMYKQVSLLPSYIFRSSDSSQWMGSIGNCSEAPGDVSFYAPASVDTTDPQQEGPGIWFEASADRNSNQSNAGLMINGKTVVEIFVCNFKVGF